MHYVPIPNNYFEDPFNACVVDYLMTDKYFLVLMPYWQFHIHSVTIQLAPVALLQSHYPTDTGSVAPHQWPCNGGTATVTLVHWHWNSGGTASVALHLYCSSVTERRTVALACYKLAACLASVQLYDYQTHCGLLAHPIHTAWLSHNGYLEVRRTLQS